MEFRNPSSAEPMHMSAKAIPNAPQNAAQSFRFAPASSSARTSSASAAPAALVPDPATLVPNPSALVPDPAARVFDPAALVPDAAALVPDPAALVPDPAVLVPDPALPSSSSPALVPSAADSLAERIAAAEAGISKSISEQQLRQLEHQPKQGAWHVVDAGVLQVVVPSTVHMKFWNTSNWWKSGMGWAYVQLVPVEVERPGVQGWFRGVTGCTGGGSAQQDGGGGGGGGGWRDRAQRKLASAVQKLEGLFQGN